MRPWMRQWTRPRMRQFAEIVFVDEKIEKTVDETVDEMC
jgi:hypothetical protein